jgi:hypothetical protein
MGCVMDDKCVGKLTSLLSFLLSLLCRSSNLCILTVSPLLILYRELKLSSLAGGLDTSDVARVMSGEGAPSSWANGR